MSDLPIQALVWEGCSGGKADSSPVIFIEHTVEREVVEEGMMGREKGRRREVPSFSLFPSHLALPFLVPIFPCAVSLLYDDDWGRVRGIRG